MSKKKCASTKMKIEILMRIQVSTAATTAAIAVATKTAQKKSLQQMKRCAIRYRLLGMWAPQRI